MSAPLMTLEIMLPSRVFARVEQVSSVVVQTAGGGFGLLPQRLDCVAALVAGILLYTTATGETCLAVDCGVLVKTGPVVRVAVRDALGGASLAELRAAVTERFLALDADERATRGAMARLETGFIEHAAHLRHD